MERRTEHNLQIEGEIHVEKIPNLVVDHERLEEFLIEEREEKNRQLQVNLYQKLLFLHQLTHNMTTDCSLNQKFNT